jgi:putative protease
MKLAGIDSFKIEGRTKSIYYLSIITRAYRKAIDDLFSEKPFDESLMDEVNTVANRDYITGFLERNPKQNGENYSNSHLENQTHIFCGLVKETNDNKIRIAVRNRFEEGEILELVTPDETVVFEVKEILSVKGKKKQIAHGGGEDVWLSLNRSVEEFALIRKPLLQAVN